MQDFELAKKLAAQRLAQYGQQVGFDAPQGQMVSGHYIAPNAFQYLAAGLRTAGGLHGQKLAQDELKALTDQERQATANALRQFGEFSQGKERMAGDGMGPPEAAQKPDMLRAFQALSQAPDPNLRQTGMQGVISTQQQQAAAQAKAQEQARLSQVLQSMTPQQAIAAGVPPELVKNYYESRNYGRDKVTFQDVGGEKVPVTDYGERPAGVAPLQKTGNPFTDLVVRGPDGQIAPNAPLVGVKRDIAAAGASKTPVQVNLGQKGFDNTLKLRSDFRSEPIYKAHQEMQSAYSQIRQALGQASPAGDLAGATKIMKLLDPGSVVRESELAMAMQASGALDRLQNYAANVVNGTKLTPAQRKDFQTLADALYSESVSQYNNKRVEYSDIADRNGLNVVDVVGPESSAPKKAGESVNVGGQTYQRPSGMSDAQWQAYKKAVGVQ